MTSERIAKIEGQVAVCRENNLSYFSIMTVKDVATLCRLARLGLTADGLANALARCVDQLAGQQAMPDDSQDAVYTAALAAYRKVKETP